MIKYIFSTVFIFILLVSCGKEQHHSDNKISDINNVQVAPESAKTISKPINSRNNNIEIVSNAIALLTGKEQDVFADDAFSGLPLNPTAISTPFDSMILTRDEAAMKYHMRFPGDYTHVVKVFSSDYEIVYLQKENNYVIQYVDIKGKNSISEKWSKYIGRLSNEIIAEFGKPSFDEYSESLTYYNVKYGIGFYLENNTVSHIWIGLNL